MNLRASFDFIVVVFLVFSCSSEKMIQEKGMCRERNDVLDYDYGFEITHGFFPEVGIKKSSEDSIQLYLTYPHDEVGDNDFAEFSRIFSVKKKGRSYEILEELTGQEINDTCYFKIGSDVRFFALKEFSFQVFKVKQSRFKFE